jgi:hypothetical protein
MLLNVLSASLADIEVVIILLGGVTLLTGGMATRTIISTTVYTHGVIISSLF